RGERGISRKPLRAGMPGVSGELAVNTRTHTHYQYARTRLRVHWAPGIPHALSFEGRKIHANLGRAARTRRCISSSLRAQRSNPLFLACRTMDCFASLAMTNWL